MTKSQAATATLVTHEVIGSMEATAATAGTQASPFEPSVWGEFFVNYTPPSSKRSEEWMTERADQLKVEVHRMFEASNDMRVADTLMLVDVLEHLGIDNHFQEAIDSALSYVHSEEQDFGGSNELHIVALGFRLLRQHGFWISTDVFDKFRDSMGNFSTDLASDPIGLLNLYNAAHMAVPGENILGDAITFTRSHLKAMKGYDLGSPIANQISRALDIPRPRYMSQLETTHYIIEYEQEEAHNPTILELAKLEYHINRSLHLKELRDFSLWFKDLYETVKLTYTRDRAVELYFWGFGMFRGEGNSRARIMLSKILALATMMDDTYDAHATLEECENFDQAIQRWDKSATSILPEYLQQLYLKTISTFNEFEDNLEPKEKYRMPYVRKAYMLLSKCYLKEAKWCNKNYIPSFKEQVDVSSSNGWMMFLAALMATVKEATKEVFEWAISVPDVARASAEIGRFLNDISAFKKDRKNKNDNASSLECYMKEHGTTGEEAVAALSAMVDNGWRRINRACMELDRGLLSVVKSPIINKVRLCEIVYFGGNDAYTFTSDLVDHVTSVFLKPVPI